MKVKKCKICKESYQPTQPLSMVCSSACAFQYMNNQKQKNWNKKKSEMRNELKTHSDWSKELQIEINTIARLIDKSTLCISSLKPLNDKFDAGHRFSVGAYPALRFNLLNIHAQSVNQNQYLSGNPDGYDHGLSSVYGDEYLQGVHELKLKYPVLKLTIPELIQAKSRAKKIVKALKALDLVYPTALRIELRKKYNKKIGIYND
jgi:hypothetical protein